MLIRHHAVKDLCAAWGVSRPTIERWVRDPNLKMPRPVMVANKRLWPEPEIKAWFESFKMETA